MAQYATKGFIIKRCNPDGKIADAQNMTGFVGEVDITPILDSDGKAKLTVKLGFNPQETKDVDFSESSPAELTPINAVSALNAASFTGVVFSVNADSGRLQVKPKDAYQTITELQIYGVLAGALNFGNCRLNEGLGCYYKYYIDDEVITIAETVDRTENENVDLEGAQGTLTRITIKGHRNGVSVAVTTKYLDYELSQMIEGGKYFMGTVDTPAKYSPPRTNDTRDMLCTLETFDPMYQTGESLEGQEIAIKSNLYPAAIGSNGDVSTGAKTIAQFSYNFSANEYKDAASGDTINPPLQSLYTPAQWEARNLAGLLLDFSNV
jgi:hypothetical protein